MEIYLYNTDTGLVPCYDDDYDEKKKLTIGEYYKAKINPVRNIRFHRKYFALINRSWEFLNENTQEHYKNSIDVFRKSIELAAGHCEPVWNITRQEWLEIPKSIAFDKMDEAAFRDLYERVKDTLVSLFPSIIDEEFNYINEF